MAQLYEITEFVGTDISKATFDEDSELIRKQKLINDKKGYKRLLKKLDKDNCCLMEATGAYHHKLVYFL